MRVLYTRQINDTVEQIIEHEGHEYARTTLNGNLVRWEGMAPPSFVDDDQMMLIESFYQNR